MTRRLIALLAVLVLAVAACTTDEGTPAPDEETIPETLPEETEAPDDDTTDTTTPSTTAVLPQQEGGTLAAVQDRGVLNCGTRGDLPGFAVLTPDGEYEGFDSDYCRVIAAAVLGDAEAVEMVEVETPDRFTALQSGQIDVLVRNTTWTATRDGLESATFLTTTFYDGQGMMVNAGEFESVEDMDGVIVCVAAGTTTEGNAATEAARLGADWEIRSFEDVDLIQEAFVEGACDGWTSDVSQLTGLRSSYPEGPEALAILPEVFSKEPLGPAVLDGDTEWAQVVDWAIISTIAAEELGITSENVDEMLDSDNPNVLLLLGAEVEGEAALDPGLGLPTDFAYNVISQVGNYGEIFERHLAPLGLERGVNALWQDGGLMYAPPYR